MWRKLICLVCLSSILLLCTACHTLPASSQSSSNNTVTLTDTAGRSVTIPAHPQRIVAIGSALRLYCYVAGTEYLVGVERAQQQAETGRPYILANPDLANLPIVGEGHPADPNPELLLATDPDVIIAGDIMDISQLEDLQKKLGIPVVITTFGSQAVFDEATYQSLRLIGEIVGKEDRAEEIIHYMESCQTELDHLTKDIPESQKRSVYVGGLSNKGSHGIESTSSQSPLLQAIHANNVADELSGQDTVAIDKEKIIAWDPEVLVIDANGLALVKEDYRKNPAFYQQLSAVKEGRVYRQLPYVSYYNNIETALADIYYLGSLLYPDAFQNIDPVAKADEMYQFFLDTPLYDVMAERFGGYGSISLAN